MAAAIHRPPKELRVHLKHVPVTHSGVIAGWMILGWSSVYRRLCTKTKISHIVYFTCLFLYEVCSNVLTSLQQCLSSYKSSLSTVIQGTSLHVHPVHRLTIKYCSQIHSPWLGDIVDFGIGLSYRPVSLLPGGPVRQPYAGVNFIPPVRDYEFG